MSIIARSRAINTRLVVSQDHMTMGFSVIDSQCKTACSKKVVFAVHCLRRWVFEGKDLAAYLPVLKTYMGHHSFTDTSQYLRLTAELYPDITAKVEKSFGHVIPVMEGDTDESD